MVNTGTLMALLIKVAVKKRVETQADTFNTTMVNLVTRAVKNV